MCFDVVDAGAFCNQFIPWNKLVKAIKANKNSSLLMMRHSYVLGWCVCKAHVCLCMVSVCNMDRWCIILMGGSTEVYWCVMWKNMMWKCVIYGTYFFLILMYLILKFLSFIANKLLLYSQFGTKITKFNTTNMRVRRKTAGWLDRPVRCSSITLVTSIY